MKNIPILFLFCLFAKLHALPSGHQVKHGEVEVHSHTNALHISTADQKAIIHWKDFSIDNGERVKFIQPNVKSAILNRVTGGNPSKIYGMLQANGAIYLINKHGIIVGEKGIVDTGSFTASTLDLLNSDFLDGNAMQFLGEAEGSITNLGTIKAWDGNITLLGYQVSNAGNLEADQVLIGVGKSILLKPKEGLYIQVQSDDSKGEVGISHSGTITAIETHLQADGNLYALAIKDDGVIDATTSKEVNGRVYLSAEGGLTEVRGKILAPQGHVKVLGKKVGLVDEGIINVSGPDQAGMIHFGGGYQGQDPHIPNAEAIYIGPKTQLLANGIDSGHGGTIITWGNNANRCYGRLHADGGTTFGDGGLVEVSTKGHFDFRGEGSATAPHGKLGLFLFDPTDVTVNGAATAGMSAGPTYTGTANSGNILNTDIQTFLNTPTNVSITTSSGFAAPLGGILNITVPILWTTAATLTLSSDDVMTFSAQVSSTGGGTVVANGAAGMNVNAEVSTTGAGTITLTSTAGSITLGSVAASTPTITSVSGDITLTANGSVNINATASANTIVSTSNGGSIAITATNGNINMTPSGANVAGVSSFFAGTTMNAGGNINIDQGSVAAIFGPLDITAGGTINILNAPTIIQIPQVVQDFTITAGQDILITNSTVQQFGGSPSNFNFFAGRDIQISQNSTIFKQTRGNLTFVVDNNFAFPALGPGRFILDATSIINHTGTDGGVGHGPGPIRIFTSRRSQNTIDGLIRNTAFVAGPYLVDTDMEQWCTTYPNPYSFYPFVIFYKECDFVAVFQNSSAPIVTVEALRDLHPYDEYLGWPLYFDYLYREIERSPIPYYMKTDKRFANNPKDKEVETFDNSTQLPL